MACFCARVKAVDVGIENSIECHSGGTCGHHGDGDPQQFGKKQAGGKAEFAPSEQGTCEGEGEGENRMLELDHFER